MRQLRKRTYFKKKLLLFLLPCLLLSFALTTFSSVSEPVFHKTRTEPIKWVEFKVPYAALEKAMNADIDTYGTENHLNWIELLAYLSTKYGGDFSRYKESDMNSLIEKLEQGNYTAHLAKYINPSLYEYYMEAYTAILGGFLGEYQIMAGDSDSDSAGKSASVSDTPQAKTAKKAKTIYGLKAFSPIAAGYWYNDYDDFGAGRSYGYKRRHLGHDLMISTGTPIIAIESGIVEALGWNQYGGWRIGIRSLDGKRYYYYAHLRKDTPYAKDLFAGKLVTAGDVIGYSGQTGYSSKENTNNIDTPHLHLGMQLIFEEEKKDSSTQIWVDLYDITRLLSSHRADVVRDEETGRFVRKYPFIDPAAEDVQMGFPGAAAADPDGGISEKSNGNAEANSSGFAAADPDARDSGVASVQKAAKNKSKENSFLKFFGKLRSGAGKTTTAKVSSDQSQKNPISSQPKLSQEQLKGHTQPLHTADAVDVPILMYHGLLKDSRMQNKFVISPDRFEDDLKYLKDKGYSTIFMTDLINYVKKGEPLPEKPIILTFDDGYYNNYLYAYPLLKKYKAKAVISIIGHYTELYSQTDPNHPNYSHITWDQLDDMINSGYVEIQNHTYDMHTYDKGRRGAMQKNGEDDPAYQNVLDTDVGLLQQKILKETGWLPNTFAYPFGYLNENSDSFMKAMGFEATLSCSEGINHIDRTLNDPQEQLYSLKRILRPPNMSSSDFFEKHKIL